MQVVFIVLLLLVTKGSEWFCYRHLDRFDIVISLSVYLFSF